MAVTALREIQDHIHKKTKQEKFDHQKIAAIFEQTTETLKTNNKITLDCQQSSINQQVKMRARLQVK